MREDAELQDRLRRLASAEPREASAAVERALRAKFRARRGKRLWHYAVELAATLVAVAGLYLALTHGRSRDQRAGAAGLMDRQTGFIALPYAQSDVPMEQPVIVRVNISASELGGMGLAVTGVPENGKVSAELLVGQDGVARAVRLGE